VEKTTKTGTINTPKPAAVQNDLDLSGGHAALNRGSKCGILGPHGQSVAKCQDQYAFALTSVDCQWHRSPRG